MTVANLYESIERALTEKSRQVAHGPSSRSHEGTPRISKTEAEHIVQNARQGAGPIAFEESIRVAIFVLGKDHAEVVEILNGREVSMPDYGQPGKDYTIDDFAIRVFDSFFVRHNVPVAEGRVGLKAEMEKQILALGKPRAAPELEKLFRVELKHPTSGDPFVGWVDADGGGFFIEEPKADRKGESIFYGRYVIDGRVDVGRR